MLAGMAQPSHSRSGQSDDDMERLFESEEDECVKHR